MSTREKMREIEGREYGSQVTLIENGSYDNENRIMNFLGRSHYDRLRQIIREDFEEDEPKNNIGCQSPTKVLKRSDTEKLQHVRKMIRKDFEDDQ